MGHYARTAPFADGIRRPARPVRTSSLSTGSGPGTASLPTPVAHNRHVVEELKYVGPADLPQMAITMEAENGRTGPRARPRSGSSDAGRETGYA